VRVMWVHADVTIVLCGGGGVGFVNGQCQDALFGMITGVALAGSVLYVADAGNNAIRAIGLQSGAYPCVCVHADGGMCVHGNVCGPVRRCCVNSCWEHNWRNGVRRHHSQYNDCHAVVAV
jgi:hypothetical protein